MTMKAILTGDPGHLNDISTTLLPAIEEKQVGRKPISSELKVLGLLIKSWHDLTYEETVVDWQPVYHKHLGDQVSLRKEIPICSSISTIV